jgi:hypothetical protein
MWEHNAQLIFLQRFFNRSSSFFSLKVKYQLICALHHLLSNGVIKWKLKVEEGRVLMVVVDLVKCASSSSH